MQEVDNDMAKIEIKLKDEVKMKLTDNERTAHNNTWRTYRELFKILKKSRGKVYSLFTRQCTQVLVDKMKQDNKWVRISTLFDPSLLFKLIKKFVLKQSDNQYNTAVLIAEQLSILQLRQYDQVSNTTYYN